MSSLFEIGIFCSVITFSYFDIPLVHGHSDHPIDLDSLELEKLALADNIAFQGEHHQGMPYEQAVQHHDPASLLSELNQLHQYHPQPNYEQATIQSSENNQNLNQNQNQSQNQNQDKLPILKKDKERGSIVINAEKHENPPAPIIISHGKMLKHYSDIIIHDQRCGTPTRIKETKHGFFGLFHKSHIIIIGKDCEHHKMIPIFAPKLHTPIHLHQEQNQQLQSHLDNHNHNHHHHHGWAFPEHHNDDDHWHSEHDHGWPEAEEQRTSSHKVPYPHSTTIVHSHRLRPTPHSYIHNAHHPEHIEKVLPPPPHPDHSHSRPTRTITELLFQ